MKFKPTKYQLTNVLTGRVFADEGWTLADPQTPSPSLVRAVYETRLFEPREDLKGLYRYAQWLPICRTLEHSHAPITYKSKGSRATGPRLAPRWKPAPSRKRKPSPSAPV